jgi:hypothetical protein
MLYTNPSAGRADFQAYARAVAASAIAPTLPASTPSVPSFGPTVAALSRDAEKAQFATVISIYRLSYEQLSLARTTTTPAGSGVSEPPRKDREFSTALAFVSAMLSRSPSREAIQRRLTSLWAAAKLEASEGGVPLSITSVEDFARFFSRFPNVAMPDLVMTPAGNLRAEWQGPRGQFLGVEFKGSNSTRYVLFAKDPADPTQLTRLSQSISTHGLFSALGVYDLSWMNNG